MSKSLLLTNKQYFKIIIPPGDQWQKCTYLFQYLKSVKDSGNNRVKEKRVDCEFVRFIILSIKRKVIIK